MKQVPVSDIPVFLASDADSGLQVDNTSKALKIVYVEDIYTSASTSQGSSAGEISADLVTASLTQSPLTGSLQVYLNGMLQVASGSAGSIFDFVWQSDKLKVEFVTALDTDDVVQIKYIQR